MPGNLDRINGVWERSFEGNCYLKLINSVVTGLYHLTEMLWGLNGIIHLRESYF